jgi:hypothetical protein
MMLTSVAMYSSNYAEAIVFSVRNCDPDARYQVRAMTGLDAAEIVPKYYGLGTRSLSRFYDFGVKAREIVIRVVLNPSFRLGESYSDIRDDLYRAISANRTGVTMLHFNASGSTIARIPGQIIKFEVGHFNQLPEVQITLRCSDPMFRALNPVSWSAAEISTSNPIHAPDSASTAPHGLSFQATFKTASPSFTIQDVQTNPDWKFTVTPNGGFAVGDVLYFSSDYSNKYLYMIRGGVTTYLIDVISPGSLWPIIFPGQNDFWFVDLAKINWNKMEYYEAYWGV